MDYRNSVFDRRTLGARCTAHVRDQIIAGELKPGEHLVEMRLSEELGISRGTLRAALRPLELEGLLVGDGRGHLLVRELSAQEILEVFEVRTALEIVAATRLAARPDRSLLTAELLTMLEPLRDPTLIPFASQIEVDLGFHARMCELSDNLTLVSSWQRLIGQIEMMVISSGPAIAGTRMRFQEHVVIIDAIESGDLEHVRRTITEHMDHFSQKYVSDAVTRENESPH